MKRVSDLTEAEALALAISNEEEDSKIYLNFAARLRAEFPASAEYFEKVASEEQTHRHRLLDLYSEKYGKDLPYVTRQDIRGFTRRRPVWLNETLQLDTIRAQAELMEQEAVRFYERAAQQARDVDVRRLFADLAETEKAHVGEAHTLARNVLTPEVRSAEDEIARRRFLLQVIQPGLAGLIDGSVSTLAPIFAAAFATHVSWNAFLVGLAAAIGAGISMGFTEALSDDGAITGRGHPLMRGLVCGLMTAVGGLGHTIPYLIPDFWTATEVAGVVVVIELLVISTIRWRFMDTPMHTAAIQVFIGGLLVLVAGILIGSF